MLALVVCVAPVFAAQEEVQHIKEQEGVIENNGIDVPEAGVEVTILDEDGGEEASGYKKKKRNGFLREKEIKEEIEKYYKQHVPNRMIIRLYLLAINRGETTSYSWVKAETKTSSNEMWVYFMEGRSPSTAKDFYGNIDSRKEKIMLAKFDYDYLKDNWRISIIEQFRGEKIFNVDD